MTTRIQLTLFVPGPEAGPLENLRLLLDPVQHSLIPAHVTLCREDELELLDPDSIAARVAASPVKAFTLRFGKPEGFFEHGILLPCVAGEPDFRALREHLLGSVDIRRASPHMTLAHPRNPKAPGNALANAMVLPELFAITFTGVSLIEQTGATPWRVRGTFPLPV